MGRTPLCVNLKDVGIQKLQIGVGFESSNIGVVMGLNLTKTDYIGIISEYENMLLLLV